MSDPRKNKATKFIVAVLKLAIIAGFLNTVRPQEKEAYEITELKTRGMNLTELSAYADSLSRAGQSDSALIAYTVVANRYNRDMSLADKILCIQAHQKSAMHWIMAGDNLNALQVLMSARKISEANHTDSLTIEILNNSAYIYLTFKNYEKADTLFSRAYQLNRKFNNPDADFRLLNNLASVHLLLSQPARASTELAELQKIQPRTDRVRLLAPYQISLLEGAIHNARGQWNEGAQLIRRAIDYQRQHCPDPSLECFALEDLCKSYKALDMTDSLKNALDRYLATARAADLPDKEIDALRQLSGLYENEGKHDTALALKSEYLQLADSAMNYRELARISNVEFVYETDKYKAEIVNLILDSEQKGQRIRRQTWGIIVLTCIIAVIVGLLITVYRQKKRLSESYHLLFKMHESADAETEYTPALAAKYSGSALTADTASDLAKTLQTLLADPKVYCDPELNLQKLAKLAGSNSRYVSQTINETFGKSFSTQLNECRIAEARRRLSTPATYRTLTIAAVATEIGYKNQTSFIAAFKNIVGMTPSMYLKIAKEENSAPE